MRISTLQVFNIANTSMARANEAIVKTQEQLSTGQRVLAPSDDPVASTKILQLETELARVSQYRNNIEIAQNNLELEETTLNNVLSLISRIQELTVQAGNTAVFTPLEYGAMAAEVESRLDELFNIVNTTNANGDYIFSGYKGRTQPFQGDMFSGFSYFGDEGRQQIKISNNTKVNVSDSGKALFQDIPSAENTVRTYSREGNISDPPVRISVGRVTDQQEFDRFFPEDMAITFNPGAPGSATSKTFTVTERSSGNVIAEDIPYVSGEEVTYNGVSFTMIGSPYSGVPATEATRLFGADSAVVFPFDFTPPADTTIDITVAGKTETLVVDANVTSAADLVTIFNDNGNGNDQVLAELGITVDEGGFRMPDGIDFTISGGTTDLENVMGLSTTTGTTSADGVLAQSGDVLFVDSTNKQDILTTMARLAEVMRAADETTESKDNIRRVVDETLHNLTETQTSVLEVVTSIGARINTLDSTRELHLDTELVSREVLSELRDVDYAEASSRLSAQTLILEAAQASFVRVSRLSLFDRL